MIERPYALVHEHEPSGTVHVSGAAGLDADDVPLTDDRAAVAAAFDHAVARLRSIGLDVEHIAKVSYYLADMEMRTAVDALFRERLAAVRPARMVIGVNELPLGARALVDVVAYRPT
ncbi:RidA family protein [Conexibacter stalactiti]|uniref:RidA family protein n=1 Tax=Conexibacter stalactiti TaxID=1940611 RepID=A0ABU4HYC6_9ACTN|nr:RidA family protein [Conexibacter stalactiti]MDW5597064.1 RidA family protein [Conexibacter stalactiti]MEC5037706.1 RidA family protein [Conexibacter stalactiti]